MAEGKGPSKDRPCGIAGAAHRLALARKADDHELLAAGQEAADVGLTKTESRELLGGKH